MALSQYKVKEIVDQLLLEKAPFSEGKEEAEYLWNSIHTILLSIKENLPNLMASEKSDTLVSKYKFLAESVPYMQLSIKLFELCEIELGGQTYTKHTSYSLKFYDLGRRFLIFVSVLLKKVYPLARNIDYAEISRHNAELSSFTYSRQLFIFRLMIQAIDKLFLFQKGTNYLLPNWELRLDLFFLSRASINYIDLLHLKITDSFLNQKNEILRILKLSYEVIIPELQKEYGLKKQDFFFRQVLILLEEFKKLNVLLGDEQKVEWLDKNIKAWLKRRNEGMKV